MFIGLNPSTADAVNNDPTVARCIKFGQRWGFDGMYMMNLFAFRATDPQKMMAEPDPVGPVTDAYLRRIAEKSEMRLACWGNHGAFRYRSREVRKFLFNLHCLRVNSSGEPAHPLYLPGDMKPMPLEIGYAADD